MIKSSIPRIVITALHSGSGKTTTAVGMAAALQHQGLKVAMFKCGPDYLDPSYHHQATGRPACNLDGWLMGEEAVKRTFIEHSKHSDIAIIEGVMGFFDGARPDSLEGSTAQIASWLSAPVVPVVDVSGMAGTIRLIEAGFTGHKAFKWGGIIANFAGSKRHLQLIEEALVQLPLLGGFVRSSQHSFPERHLGLKTARNMDEIKEPLAYWVNEVASTFDLQAIVDLAKGAPQISAEASMVDIKHKKLNKCRIAYALDDAFHFYYTDNLSLLEQAGSELIPFSPLNDESLPDCDLLYLGGGYPELFAESLAGNTSMKRSIHKHASQKKYIYAECGGLIYLSQSIKIDKKPYEMLGLIPGEIELADKLQALGYAEIITTKPTILGPSGTKFKGHQFRYSHIHISESYDKNYRVIRKRNQSEYLEGFGQEHILASYVHAHWASNPKIPESIVHSCASPI